MASSFVVNKNPWATSNEILIWRTPVSLTNGGYIIISFKNHPIGSNQVLFSQDLNGLEILLFVSPSCQLTWPVSQSDNSDESNSSDPGDDTLRTYPDNHCGDPQCAQIQCVTRPTAPIYVYFQVLYSDALCFNFNAEHCCNRQIMLQ